jgi:uncharacterized protein YebE (UPF0316 family)
MKYLVFFFLVVAQSMSFTFVSRARNRNNYNLALLASVCSNTTWILVFSRLIRDFNDVLMCITYVVGMAVGSQIQMRISARFFEKIKLI